VLSSQFLQERPSRGNHNGLLPLTRSPSSEVRRGIEPLYRELPVIQDLPSESNRPCIQPDHLKNTHPSRLG
jgi:hypothetical protein